jgi:uncharacterized protein DUF3987
MAQMNTYSQRESALQQFRDSTRGGAESLSEDNSIPDLDEGAMPLMRPATAATPFPVDALGPILSPAAHAFHDMTQAPLAIAGQAALGVASLIAQAHCDVLLPMQQKSPLSLFLVTIAESSERKSSVDRLAMQPIAEYADELRIQYELDQLSFRNRRDAFEQSRKALLTDKGKATDKNKAASIEADLQALGAEPTPPAKPIVQVQEPTIEGVTKLLQQGLGFAGLFSSEGAAFLGGHGMSPDNKLKTAAHLSSLWDGTPIDRIRQGDELMTLHGRRLAAHLMIQPNISERLFSDADLVRQGLLSRVLVSAPETAAGSRMFRMPSQAGVQAHKRYVEYMLGLVRLPRRHAEGRSAELMPRTLAMDEAATSIWTEFHDLIELQLAPTGDYAAIRSWAGKLLENVGRISGVLAFVEDPNSESICGKHMAGAVQLGGHYLSEAQRLFEAGCVGAELAQATKLLDWIKPRGRVYLQQVIQYGPNFVRTAATARKLLGVLTEHRWLEKPEHGAVIDGKQRKDVWVFVGGVQ